MIVNVTRHPANAGPDKSLFLGDERARATGLNPGDYILVHSHGKIAPRLIGLGQKLHHDPEFAYWTHAAVYVGDVEGFAPPGDTVTRQDMLIEAKGGQPVRYVPLEQYDVRDYAAVRYQDVSDEMRANSVAFLKAQLGKGYGYVTILNLAVWSLFGGRLTVGLAGERVCSGLTALSTMYLGDIYDGEAVTQMPADLAQKNDIRR
jgi:hypothetical protein